MTDYVLEILNELRSDLGELEARVERLDSGGRLDRAALESMQVELKRVRNTADGARNMAFKHNHLPNGVAVTGYSGPPWETERAPAEVAGSVIHREVAKLARETYQHSPWTGNNEPDKVQRWNSVARVVVDYLRQVWPVPPGVSLESYTWDKALAAVKAAPFSARREAWERAREIRAQKLHPDGPKVTYAWPDVLEVMEPVDLLQALQEVQSGKGLPRGR